MAEIEKVKVENSKFSMKGFVVFLVLALGIMIFFPGLALFLFIGLLPTLAAMISDPTKNRAQTFCVGVCNLTGLMPMLHELYLNNFNIQVVYSVIHNDLNLLIILCASAIGWGIFFAVPVITVAFYKTKDRATLIKMIRRYDELKGTWGESIPSSPTIENLKQKKK